MALPDVCLIRNGDGMGSYSGGAGPLGAASGQAGGYGVQDSGLPFIRLTTRMRKTIEFGLYRTLCGKDPIDLTDVARVVFIAKEIVNSPLTYLNKEMTVGTPATEGRVSLDLSPGDLRYAGMWPSSVTLLNADDELTDEFRCFLYVERSITDNRTDNRPLTISEVRMTLRDTCPGMNVLIDDLEFSDTEINFAMSKPIDEWNETAPCLMQYTFTPATFPFRNQWLRATCAHLLESAAYNFLRNDLRIATGGMDVDDKDKHSKYMQFSSALREEWRNWMIRKKRELNMGISFGGLRSVSFGGWSRYPSNYRSR